ncbi:hypothetical protein KFE25_003539 [Diacronema lutheri]|uniref:Leucine zipper transcription factor-like protein 1 n=1 Tax=Diacronema lutheri TaxID=2081491 RepID=A0A8J5XG13_DIALT|nr:hypothetical protein KFE25_003539 [Diacronema lutheri]
MAFGSSDLAESGQQHVREYLAFLRRKREAIVSEVAAEFKELKETRLLDETYTIDEVGTLLDGLLDAVRASLRRELVEVSHSAALLLVQVLEQLDAPGAPGTASIDLDIPRTEDGDLLRAMATFENDAASGGRAALAVRAHVGKPIARALPTIGGTARDLDSAKESAAVSAERAMKLQAQLTAVLKDKSALGEQLEAERRKREDADAKLAEARAKAGGSATAHGGAAAMADEMRSKLLAATKERDSARAELAALREKGTAVAAGPAITAELERARQEASELAAKLHASEAALNGRLETSAPFKNVRTMLAKKNALVKTLRDQLEAAGISTGDIDAAAED